MILLLYVILFSSYCTSFFFFFCFRFSVENDDGDSYIERLRDIIFFDIFMNMHAVKFAERPFIKENFDALNYCTSIASALNLDYFA